MPTVGFTSCLLHTTIRNVTTRFWQEVCSCLNTLWHEQFTTHMNFIKIFQMDKRWRSMRILNKKYVKQ